MYILRTTSLSRLINRVSREILHVRYVLWRMRRSGESRNLERHFVTILKLARMYTLHGLGCLDGAVLRWAILIWVKVSAPFSWYDDVFGCGWINWEAAVLRWALLIWVMSRHLPVVAVNTTKRAAVLLEYCHKIHKASTKTSNRFRDII